MTDDGCDPHKNERNGDDFWYDGQSEVFNEL